MRIRENNLDSPAGVVRDFVGCVLDELEKLPVTVSALCDTAFAIGVLGYETGVHGIGPEDAGGLFEYGFDD
jgi:hypothetical protein